MFMNIKITEETPVALIALLGVIISCGVSYYISSTQVESAAKSLRLEFEQRINQKLFEKRLDVYPELYILLGDFGRKIEGNEEITRGEMKNTLEKVDDWDRKNSVFVSSAVIAQILTIRTLLAPLSSEKSQAKPLGMKDKRSLFRAALDLQKALRAELGVYRESSFREAITDPAATALGTSLQINESKMKATQ